MVSGSDGIEKGEMMLVEPLEDRVLVEREKPAYQTASGLYLPEGSEDRSYPEVGVVKAVGPGRVVNKTLVPVSVSVGDRVVFGRYAGTEVMVDTIEYVMMQESEIIARADEDADIEWSLSL